MIGHKQIITARQQGFKPVAVFIEAGLAKLPLDYEKTLASNTYPVVHFGADELTKRHDLRFLAGCRVHIHCEEITDEVLALAESVVRAAAPHIVVCGTESTEIMEYKNKEWQAWKS